MSNLLFPEDYFRVNANDPCHTFVPIEDVPAEEEGDEESFFDFKQTFSLPAEMEYPLEVEDNKWFACVRKSRGCAHISAVQQKEDEEEIKFHKSPRQKFIDKVKAGTASRLAYNPRFADTGCWYNYRKRDKRTRDKKFVEVKKKNRQRTIAKMKIAGFPIFQSEKLGIFDTIIE